MVNAVIYVRPENYSASAARCLDYCAARRYNVVGLIPGDWDAAMRMLHEGVASVVVVSSSEQVELQGEPGVEVAPKPSSRRKAGARSAANSARGRWSTGAPTTSAEPAAARHYRY